MYAKLVAGSGMMYTEAWLSWRTAFVWSARNNLIRAVVVKSIKSNKSSIGIKSNPSPKWSNKSNQGPDLI
jgi:hypothetical protein